MLVSVSRSHQTSLPLRFERKAIWLPQRGGTIVNDGGAPTRAVSDWLTIMAIAAISLSLTTTLHEGVHALVCIAVGGDLREYSALHVLCESPSPTHAKFVAGSASLVNM